MKTVRIERFGGSDVLEVVDVPTPVAAPEEVLIRVSRAGVNFADTHARENTYLAKQTLPFTPGVEVAGTVADGTQRFPVGMRVVAKTPSGGYAEYACAPAETVFPIPDDIDYESALALLVQGVTAWHILHTSAGLRSGESVAVHSAAGGVGSLAVQLAKAMGAGRVIASAGTDEKRRKATQLGADIAIDSVPEGMTAALIAANLGRKLDIVLEMVGGEVFDQSLAALAPFGRLVTYGISSRKPNTVKSSSLMRRSQAIVGFWIAHCFERRHMIEEPLHDLFDRLRRGELKPTPGGTYPLSEARRAHDDLEARRTTGKLFIDPSG